MDVPEVQIKQAELQEISDLEREVAWRKVRLEELKSTVKALLMSRIPVESGRFDVKLRKQICRNVPWKSLVLEKLGEGVANWFRSLYPPHVRFEVEVIEHAVMPLWNDSNGSMNIH